MPKYYLHHRYGSMRVTDPEGENFPDVAAARRDAIIGARELMGNRLSKGELPNFGGCVEICDEQGRKIDQVTYRDALMM